MQVLEGKKNVNPDFNNHYNFQDESKIKTWRKETKKMNNVSYILRLEHKRMVWQKRKGDGAALWCSRLSWPWGSCIPITAPGSHPGRPFLIHLPAYAHPERKPWRQPHPWSLLSMRETWTEFWLGPHSSCWGHLIWGAEWQIQIFPLPFFLSPAHFK